MSDATQQDRGKVAEAVGATGGVDEKTRQMVGVGVCLLAMAVGVYYSLTTVKADRRAVAAPAAAVRVQTTYEPPAPQKDLVHAGVMTVAPAAVKVDGRSEMKPSADEQLLESARRAPVIAFKRAMPATTVEGSVALTGGSDAGVADDKGAFEQRLKAPRLDAVKAGLIGDRNFVVAMGTSIPCVLETALQSDQAGFTSCVIPRDVLSDNGRVVLMEKGTQVVGQYRGGLAQGQTRLHVLWSRAKTPTGVVIELASAGIDELGRAGFNGEVDSHWMERFGSALLLSVVSDASKVGVQAFQNSTGLQATQTGNAGKEAAGIAVEQAAAIKPTLHKNQGDVVGIFVARDLHFENVYGLEIVGGGSRRTTKVSLK